jgi:branched-subunit amino acid aminotransferase/4-amino-4-deoxychorismate lyase
VIHRNVFHDESLLPIEDVRLSPGQAGLICGWGLFTTLRIFRGEAFAYERHWRRLEKDAAIIRLPMPYSSAKVRINLHEVIRANQVAEGCARIYLVYNQVGFCGLRSGNTGDTRRRRWPASRQLRGYKMFGRSLKRKKKDSTKWCCLTSAAKLRNARPRTFSQ